MEEKNPKRHRMFWTDEEITYLLEHYHEMSNAELAKKLGRTKRAIIQAYQKFRPDNERRNKRDIYAYYKGDELVVIGTAKEIAEYLNLRVPTIYWYHCRPESLKNVKIIKVEKIRGSGDLSDG